MYKYDAIVFFIYLSFILHSYKNYKKKIIPLFSKVILVAF